MDSREMPINRRKTASGEGETSSSSSSISKNDYEVFLSFRGPDTRQGFTDCLYHALIDAGICVFRDDDELALGDKIDDILTALNNSKICIVVLSPKFAESSWCLREVERMVAKEKHIVPIFYHVIPADVKLETKLYANALTGLETEHGKERVQKWKGALKQIPTIKGRALKNTGYTKFSKQIAKEILTKLKVKVKYGIKNLVQVADEVEAAMKLLDIGSNQDRRFVGIHGMGGIGKTTLAKIIFNQIFDKFDCSCLLENIRDYSSEGPGGLHKLQEWLLKSLDPSIQDNTLIVDPMRRIQTNFQRKKVFIVLDDVDQQNHLGNLVGDSSWFGEGSRIIFTTRNAQIHEQTTSSNTHFYGLEKKEMDSKQALTLFSRHAFGEDSPPKDFESLSTEAISTLGGLPLALEVVGSFLHRKKIKVWRDMVKKLDEAPHQDVQRKLKLSYDALDVEQQEIFLDIACFFIGVPKKNAAYMWKASKFYPNHGIEVLISMSLIKLDEKKCFLMHDQLRDLGRAIVKVNSGDVRAGSRLWIHKDALDMLKRNMGKEKVKALRLKEPASGYFDRDNFVGLEELRFLELVIREGFGGDFDSLLPKLRWLSLSLLDAARFNVTNLYLRELVVLELSGCRFDENWPGWGQILISKQLKVLTLSCCSKLVNTPDLSKIVNLKRLVLENCVNLTSIHSSLGELVKLKHLSLRECKSLRVLPDSIGDLRSLISLDLFGSGITELPTTIGRLAKLKFLCLDHCLGLERLPDSIGNLQSLIDMDASDTSIAELPHSFGNLASLQKLQLMCSRVTSLPDSFIGLQKLVSLGIGGKYFGVPIKHLWIRELRALPKGLTTLVVECVDKIQNLSDLINLSRLGIVNIAESEGLVVLEGFEKLIKLKELRIECDNVRSLSMEEWGALQHLEKLRLRCPSLEFGKFALPSNLDYLHLLVKDWGKLPSNLSSLKKLRKLDLINFVIEEADWIEGLECLEFLQMRNCMVNEFLTLRNLHLESCSLPTMPCLVIPQLNHLVELRICHCKNLGDIQGIGKLKSLTKLWIHDCDSLRRVEDLSELNRLETVLINKCQKFEGIENVDRLLSAGRSLPTTLHIRNCKCDNVGQLTLSMIMKEKMKLEEEIDRIRQFLDEL